MSATVIVLDGAQRAALAVVRSLGERGLRVVVAADTERSIAGASRWCAQTAALPSPDRDADAFVSALEALAKRETAALVFPITDASLTALQGRARLANARVASAHPESYNAVSNKATLAARAERLGVPVPRSIPVADTGDLEAALTGWQGPVVIKPAFSKFRRGASIRSTSVAVLQDAEQARARITELDWLGPISGLVQEFIPGHGAGLFTVYGRQGPLHWFAHRRLREKPPSGGVSVLCESAPVDPTLRDYAKALLDDAGWLGPAMVEFRIDADGKPWLMEINGRFWGSLQLSIDSGLDLPWSWYRVMNGENPAPQWDYETGRKLRWLLGDLDNLYLTLRNPDVPGGARARAALRFLNFFSPRTRLEVLRLGDMRPFLRELGLWLGLGDDSR
ncbi:MAG TPA: ATP-grasp domain-containing protein [Woeseiaceae bacterium]|nr:ATP-grasp domain-containing protein [Woeseiaceae bacterium]